MSQALAMMFLAGVGGHIGRKINPKNVFLFLRNDLH